MKFAIKALTASVILACAGSAMAQKGETVKVAWIDPLGPDGSAGIQPAQKPAVRG
jgi:hypothetical protein